MKFLAAFLLTATQFAYPVAAQDKGLAAPTRLWAAQTDPTTITLVWQGVPGAEQYLVFGPKLKKGDAGAAIQQLATLGRNAARYVTTVVSPGLSHQFSIRAVDAKGQLSDPVEFNAVIPQPKQAASTTVPPPSSVTASQTGSGEVRLAWSAVPNATGYFIGRSVAPGGFKTLCQLCPTETNYIDSAVTAGAKHIYTVAAITPFGMSQTTWSNEVTPTGGKEAGVAGADAPLKGAPEKAATDSAGSTPAPKALSELKATVVSPTSVQLTWLPGIGAASFRIKRTVGSMAAELIATMAGTVSSFLDLLPPGSLAGGIGYEIEAVDAKGSSEKATVAIAPEKPRDGPGPDPGAGGGAIVPSPAIAGCTAGARYTTCNSALYEINAVENVKTGSVLCPVGYAALGGGYEGILVTAMVQASRPLPGSAKEPAGWTVTVHRFLLPSSSDAAYLASQAGQRTTPIKFAVYVVCAPAS